MEIDSSGMVHFIQSVGKSGETYQLFIPSWCWQYDSYELKRTEALALLIRDIALPYSKEKIAVEELVHEITSAQSYPCISMGEGDLIFHYDVYIWGPSWFIVYNPYLGKIEVQRMASLLEQAKHLVLPSWSICSEEIIDLDEAL